MIDYHFAVNIKFYVLPSKYCDIIIANAYIPVRFNKSRIDLS